MSDQYARWLLDPIQRQNIYEALNPCNYHQQDNCPSAAQALFEFLNDGQVPKRGGPQLSGRPALCPQLGQGFLLVQPTSFSAPSAGDRRSARQVLTRRGTRSPSTKRVQLIAIIELVRRGPPGNHVVIEGLRSPSSSLAQFHYGSLVRLGPPEDDVFYADCSRPDARFFYPSQSGTHPGGWPHTIEGFLLYPAQQIQSFGYTRGPVRFSLQPVPQQQWRSGSPKQAPKMAIDIAGYRPNDEERGLQ